VILAVAGSSIAAADSPPAANTTAPAPCIPLKAIYSEHHWREAHPMRGENPCREGNARKVKEHFFLYRRYRQITPYRCQRGSYGTWAIPCYIIACESHFSWSAANPSGAVGPYQELGWGAPFPVRNFRDKLRHHEIAHSLSLSNWVCA
jgi:hypothetical protein